MQRKPAVGLRAVGTRCRFEDAPAAIREWVEAQLGEPIRSAVDRIGGMSPGIAVRLEGVSGARLFVKAVGHELNADTPELFRHELRVLSQLPSASYRSRLVDSYDDGQWVALLLEDVEGRHPDFRRRLDAESVTHAVNAQVRELTPAPPALAGMTSMKQVAERWVTRWASMVEAPGSYLPAWAQAQFAALSERVRSLPSELDCGRTLCHFDIRDDNILIRPDQTAVILDWGMARIGPAWIDPVLVTAQEPNTAATDRALPFLEQAYAAPRETVTSFLIAFAGSQAWNARRPPRAGLPAMAGYCQEDSDRLFEIARRLLQAQ